jgi:hypothetical protein
MLFLMRMGDDKITQQIDEDNALRAIVEGTARATGERFFESLVENLARALNTHGAWVTEFIPATKRSKTLTNPELRVKNVNVVPKQLLSLCPSDEKLPRKLKSIVIAL